MTHASQHETLRVLDELVCDAIGSASSPPPTASGRNQGITVLEELMINLPALEHPAQKPAPRPTLAGWEIAIRAEAERLAAWMSITPNPAETASQFHDLLLVELSRLPNSDSHPPPSAS